MTASRRVTLAAFLVGVAVALASELAAGLLLYASDGFLQALTLVLGVGLAALGLGLAAPAPERPRGGALRRRWLFALVAYAAAAVVSAAWSLGDGLAGSAMSRGVALALLEALPLYAAGGLLAGLDAGPGGRVGAAAVLGAALGVVLQGTVLLVRLQPTSVYLLGVVLLSTAALVHGRRDPLPPGDTGP